MVALERAGQLRKQLDSGQTLEMPSAHDALTARCIEMLGFGAVYAGGSYTASNEFLIPDIGMLTVTELIDHARRLVDAVAVPVVVDIDDGGGNPLRVRKSVHDALHAGIAGIQLEDLDSTAGKHLGPKNQRDSMLPIDLAVKNIEAAAEARGDSGLVIVARTEAAVLGSREDIVERAERYARAGADLIMVAHLTPEDFTEIRQTIKAPMAQFTLSLPPGVRDMYLAAGVEMLVYPRLATMPAFAAAWDALTAFRRTGEFGAVDGEEVHRENYRRAIGADDWLDFGARYGL